MVYSYLIISNCVYIYIHIVYITIHMYTYSYTYLYRYMYPKRTDACSQAPRTCPMAGPWLRGENGVVSCAGAYSRQGAEPVTLLLIG